MVFAVEPAVSGMPQHTRTRPGRVSGRLVLRRFVGALALLVALVALAAGAVNGITWHGPRPNAKPKCDGQLMSPGDLCNTTRNGAAESTQSYYDRLDEVTGPTPLSRPAWIAVAVAGVAMLAGYVVISSRASRALRARRSRAPGAGTGRQGS